MAGKGSSGQRLSSTTFIRRPSGSGSRVHYGPEPGPVTEQRSEWELRVRRRGEYTSVFYDFCPLDIAGWKGTHCVFKLNIKDFRPLMSEGIHLPPSAHATLEGDGFVVCTFAP